MLYVTARIRNFLRSKLIPLEKSPVFVLGNQKSGTSIIVELLGRSSGLSYTNDFTEMYEPVQSKIHSGNLELGAFIRRNARIPFSRKIIKEPGLTFLFYKLEPLYPAARYVFIIRDPRDNIRSILNRVKTRGDLEELDVWNMNLIPEWKKILDNRWLGLGSEHYIASMAERWNLAAEVYLENRERMHLIRYEDFVKKKTETIESVLKELNIAPVNDIRSEVNVQYQTKGDSNVKWLEFFGKKNLHMINEICSDNMKEFGYTHD